jgi:hypothetical protein
LQKLIEISKEYDRLKLEYSKKEKLYFENNNVDDLVKEVQNGNLPKWKQIERDYEEVEYQFIRIAKEFGKENKFSNKELIIQITEEILNSNFQSINQFLLIRLIWDLGIEANRFCLKTLEKWIRMILKNETIGYKEEYYLESLIDIWNYDTDELIPIDILEQIILSNPETDSKGALIKATSYLSNHPKEEREKVLAKAKETSMYKDDEDYRDWID